MDLGRLIARCRTNTTDTEKPYFWSDEEWTDYLNEACDEATIRARLIENDQIEVELSANDAYAEYPGYVWAVQRVFLGSLRLQLVDKEMLDASEPEGWESQSGTPIACYEVGGKLRFFPVPDASGTARLVAFCTPEDQMMSDSDVPQGIKDRLHVKLIDWALACAYNKPDADTFDPGRAAKHEAVFESTFGPRPDEKAMRRKRINVRRFVAGSYF
jgi:hypothetical protein